MGIRRLDHVQLAMPAGREAEAVAFYEGVLGIPHVPKPDHLAARGGCWFEDGNLKVHLGVDASFRPATKAHLAFIVSEGAVVWVLGAFARVICALMAFVLAPAVGLFGDANAGHERVIGAMAALTCGPAVVAGPLVIGARSHNVSVLVPAAVVAVSISVGVLVAAW